MEVDRSEASVTTQKEDAASIVGDELAEELEEKAKLIGKSEALVVRADETCPDGEKMVDGKCTKCDSAGNPIMGKSEAVVEPVIENKVDYSPILSAIAEIKSLVTVEKPKAHPLDAVISQFKSEYDNIVSESIPSDEKLQKIQASYAKIGETVVELVSPKKTEVSVAKGDATDVVSALREVMQPITQQLGLLSTQLADLKQQPAQKSVVMPKRMSINPLLVQQAETEQKVQSVTPSLRAMLERNANKALQVR